MGTAAIYYNGSWLPNEVAVIKVLLSTFILYLFLSEKIVSGITGGGVKG